MARKKNSQRNSAGLAIHDKGIYFLEVDEHGNESRKASVPLPEGCVVNGSIKDFSMLEEAFKSLQQKTGKIREPVTIGLPPGDTVIRRPIVFPRMTIEDIRSAIDLNFEEYFTSRTDTIFDVQIISTPSDAGDKDKVSVLAATTKQSLVEKILDIAKKADIPAGAIEPLNFAMIRAIPQASEGLCIFADHHNIVATWEGHGIFFRTVNNLSNFQDVSNTIQFISTQYRNTQVSKIILAGVDFQLSTDSAMRIVNINEPYYSARGLALRESFEDGLDLRPAEYVELERRRYAFSIDRLALWGLLAGFLIMSVGTIAYAWLTIHAIDDEIHAMSGNVDGLSARRSTLEQRNSQLETSRKTAEKILDFLKGDIPVLEILNAIEANMTNGVKYDNADFTAGAQGASVVIDGKAQSDRDILTMTEGLKRSGLFSSVTLPMSQRDQQQRSVFRLTLRVKDILAAR